MSSLRSRNVSVRRARPWTCWANWEQPGQIVRHAPGGESRIDGIEYAFAVQKGNRDTDLEINSPEAQRALVETAGRVTQPLEIRQAAVSAFRQNLQAHGILLTKEEIKKQYQQYNESKNQDESTQKILALILDCLEAPTKAEKK